MTAAPHPGHARPVVDVLPDRHGEGVRLLEDHTDPFSQVFEIDVRVEDIHPLHQDLAFDPHAFDHVVHPVETPQIGGLSASRRSDQGGDPPHRHLEIDAFESVGLSVVEVEAPALERGFPF